MSVFDQIRTTISVTDFLRGKGYSVKSLGSGQALDICPFCGGHDCFRIYDNGTRWSCFQCPDKKTAKDVLDLQYIFAGGASYSEAIKTLAAEVGVEFSGSELEVVTLEIKTEAYQYYEYILETRGKGDIREYPFKGDNYKGTAWEFLTGLRQHSEEVIKAFHIGLSDGMLKEYLLSKFKDKEIRATGLLKEDRDQFPNGMIMFPHFVNGKISHFTCKDPTKKYKPFQVEARFRDPAWKFYNQDCLDGVQEKSVILVEGENDLLSVVDKGKIPNCVALIGNISDEQIKGLQLLVKQGFSLLMAFDGDKQGKKYRNSIIKQVGGSIYDLQVSPTGIPENMDIDDILCVADNPEETLAKLLEGVSDDPKPYEIPPDKALAPSSEKVEEKEKIPHSLEHERFVLRELIRGQAYNEILERIAGSSWFYKGVHQKVFVEVAALYEANKTVNELVVLTTLKDKGVIKEDGEFSEILNIELDSDVETSLDILEKKWRRRQFLKFSVDIQKAVEDSAKPIENLEDEISEDFFKLYQLRDSLALEITPSNISTVKLANEKAFKLVGTPYADINSALVIGFDHGKMVVIAGRTGMGKSIFKTNLKLHWCQHGVGVLDFTPENGVKLEQARLDTILSGMDFIKIWQRVDGDLTDIRCNEIHAKIEREKWPHWQYEELERFDIGFIARKVKQAKKERPDIVHWVVIADLANKIKEYDAGKDSWRSVGIANRKMKILSTKLGFCFVPIVQIGRGAETEKKISRRHPELHDLKGSGNWEEDADLVFLLFREKYYDTSIDTDIIEISLKKQRGGPPAEFRKLFGEGNISITDYEFTESIEELPPET